MEKMDKEMEKGIIEGIIGFLTCQNFGYDFTRPPEKGYNMLGSMFGPCGKLPYVQQAGSIDTIMLEREWNPFAELECK